MRFRWRLIAVAVLYLLAVKSKEMAITLPAVLLLYDMCRNEDSLAIEYEAFGSALRSLPSPEPGATIYFRSLPRHFTSEVLTSATQAVLHRTDVSPQIVEVFPNRCRYCVQFVR